MARTGPLDDLKTERPAMCGPLALSPGVAVAKPGDPPARGVVLAARLGYGREMPKRETDRRRDPGRSQASSSLPRRSSNPVLTLQRSIGNRAVGQVLAREPVRTGTLKIAGMGEIKVEGGNLEEWAGTAAPDTVEVTSKKGKHSAKLEKLSKDRTRIDVTVTIAPASKAGEELNVGGGTKLEIKHARIKGYSVGADGVETWRVADYEKAARTKITHKVG